MGWAGREEECQQRRLRGAACNTSISALLLLFLLFWNLSFCHSHHFSLPRYLGYKHAITALAHASTSRHIAHRNSCLQKTVKKKRKKKKRRNLHL